MDTGTLITIGIVLCMLVYLGIKAPLLRNLKMSIGMFLVGAILFSFKKVTGDMGWGFQWSWDSVILATVGGAILVLLLGHKIPDREASKAQPDSDGNAEKPPGVEREP